MKHFAPVLLASAFVGSAAAHAGHDHVDEPITSEAAVKPKLDRPAFEPASVKGIFVEQFQTDVWSRWSASEATKQTPVGGETFSYVGKWAVREPDVYPGAKGDTGLVVTNPAAHHAVSALFDASVDPSSEPLVVQYEVKLQKGLECGGAYIKLLTESPEGIQAEEFSDKTPYSIMFGPDRCGATNKVHLILRHKSPLTGEIEEKHLKNAPAPKITKTTALYTLVLDPSAQSYEIKINDESVKKGSLLEDFDPPIVPAAEIDDANDKKPADWVENSKIADPEAVKPEDWDEDQPLEIPDEEATKPDGWLEDESPVIPDPDAQKPEEWDDEEDGDWIPPMIPNPICEDAPGCGPWTRPTKANPSYKGKWYAPLIDNPLFKGIWKPRKITNPAYYEDKSPLSNIGRIAGLGFEIWSMQSDILFDNIYLGNSASEAESFAKQTFHVKKPVEDSAEEAEKPAPVKEAAAGAKAAVTSFAKDPLGFARARLQDFVDAALIDPVAAFKAHPQEGAVVGGILATLLGMIAFLFGAVGTKPQAVKEKATQAKAKAADAAQVVKQKAEEVAPVVEEKAKAVSSATETTTTRELRSRKGKEPATE